MSELNEYDLVRMALSEAGYTVVLNHIYPLSGRYGYILAMLSDGANLTYDEAYALQKARILANKHLGHRRFQLSTPEKFAEAYGQGGCQTYTTTPEENLNFLVKINLP